MSNELLFETVRRWFEILERRPIDADGFSSYEVWMYAQTLAGLADTNQPLPADALSMMSEIGERLGLPVGAPPAAIGAAWEQHFGECPEGPETLAKLAAYIRAQLNASYSDAGPKKGPSLTGEAKPGSQTHVYPAKDLWS